MLIQVLWCAAVLLAGVTAKTSLQEVYTWNLVDFQYPSPEARQDAIDNGMFVPGHNVPVGMALWREKIFLTIPRWRTGVPASLAYFSTADTSSSPVLKPYPDWEAHDQRSTNPRRIVSPFRLHVDTCDRLWILDTGTNDVLGNTTHPSQPKVIVYDLNSDTLLRNYTLPDNQAGVNSFFASLTVEVIDCSKTFAYLADLGTPGLVVYSWAGNRSWKITNRAFEHDPRATNFDISNFKFSWKDGVFGLALTEVDPSTKYRTLYFHAFSSFDEYRVSTEFLQDEQLTRDGKNGDKFVMVGSRTESKTQASASDIDEETGVLFYTQVNLNGIGCWNYRRGNKYSPETQELIATSDKKLVFPNDIKIVNGNIWVLSDNMIVFLQSHLDPAQINFRLLRAPVKEFVSDTKCDPAAAAGDDGNTGVTTRLGNDASATRLSAMLVILAFFVQSWL